MSVQRNIVPCEVVDIYGLAAYLKVELDNETSSRRRFLALVRKISHFAMPDGTERWCLNHVRDWVNARAVITDPLDRPVESYYKP